MAISYMALVLCLFVLEKKCTLVMTLCYSCLQAIADHSDHDHGEGGHSTIPVYKGLCALLGIYLFFIMERVVTKFTESKRRKVSWIFLVQSFVYPVFVSFSD